MGERLSRVRKKGLNPRFGATRWGKDHPHWCTHRYMRISTFNKVELLPMCKIWEKNKVSVTYYCQALTSTRYPTRPELLFCYPNPTRTTFKKFRVSGFSQQAVSQQAASNLLTIILKFCCFLVALTRNPLFN